MSLPCSVSAACSTWFSASPSSTYSLQTYHSSLQNLPPQEQAESRTAFSSVGIVLWPQQNPAFPESATTTAASHCSLTRLRKHAHAIKCCSKRLEWALPHCPSRISPANQYRNQPSWRPGALASLRHRQPLAASSAVNQSGSARSFRRCIC